MNIESIPQRASGSAGHHAVLHRQRREALATGRLGQWYSLVGSAQYPDDPHKARQFCENKLDEELALHARRIFIDGTAMPRVLPERDEWV